MLMTVVVVIYDLLASAALRLALREFSILNKNNSIRYRNVHLLGMAGGCGGGAASPTREIIYLLIAK